MAAWAKNYVGIPFAEKGRTRDGADCWGLLRLVYAERLGLMLPAYLDRYESTQAEQGERQIAEAIADNKGAWVEVEPGQEREFDGLLIRMSGLPIHVGVIIGDGLMLHVRRGTNATIESYRSRVWKQKVLGIFRHASR